ncbi:MAG: beta-galactosidase [Bacteroidales bacterium]|nr:beta-galactosidase [Bacteroidales bacterium]
MKKEGLLGLLLLLAVSFDGQSQETERVYLSGTGLGETVDWDFYCSDGQNSGVWSKIAVPSQWELQGFGAYTFGRFYLDKTAKPSNEYGLYRHRFVASNDLKGKDISLVFEGVMTDAEVKWNGRPVGTRHQGGFYVFELDVTDHVVFGKENVLEVQVWKESSNASVNAAERRADWWLFGGIYRPVYLKIMPKVHVNRLAVDARADGALRMDMFAKGLKAGMQASIELVDVKTGVSMGTKRLPLQAVDHQSLSMKWEGVNPWDCERPNLYELRVSLFNGRDKLLHIYKERIGFRTVEFRPRDGLYVNGTKLVLKGINRHSFHPDGGRTTNRQISLQDALLIKEMNMNAVRSHYPPDRHFLSMCDSLGLFYLAEFTGWHGRYDSRVGGALLEEMMADQVNHPCIVLWANGNEGGWNKQLDGRFAELDPQKRHVVHPWADFNDLDTHHYPAYQTGPGRLANGNKVFMPTEFLHAQYDKGGGAGLEDFWAQYTSNPLFAGGFIWTFVDEAVKRSDKGGILDSDGPNGPDGVVGPYREKEGSFYAIREIWSPIQFKPLRITSSFDGSFLVSNGYLFQNLSACHMTYKVYACGSPVNGARKSLVAEGTVQLPAVDPGETGKARMVLPQRFFDGDVLELEAFDASGRLIGAWSWPLVYADAYVDRQKLLTPSDKVSGKSASINVSSNAVCLAAAMVKVCFDAQTGMLRSLERDGQVVPLTNGPVPVGMKAVFVSGRTYMDGVDAVYVTRFKGAVDSIVWRLTADGLLGMDALVLNRGNGGGFEGAFFDASIDHLGFSFDYPEEQVKGMRWLGKGPYRVWRNRLKGARFGLWQKAYNNTVTGEQFESLVYPEFKGYHANMYWASFETVSSPSFTVYSEMDGLYMRVFTPEEPTRRRDGEDTMRPFPAGDLSFLWEIPGMRSFKTLPEHGPNSQPSTIRIKSGDEGLRMKVWFDCR